MQANFKMKIDWSIGKYPNNKIKDVENKKNVLRVSET